MTVQYLVSIVVHEVDYETGKTEEILLEGQPVDAVHVCESPIEAARVARFLGGTALRLPPIDTEALVDEEIIEAF